MLACILGNGGEVFFPKLGEDQMLTFSEICDNFVKAEGFSKVECASDPEAKQYAARMGYDSVRYPVSTSRATPPERRRMRNFSCRARK